MPVRFPCPHCLSRLTVSRKFAGKQGRCPNCKVRLTVPEIEIGDPLFGDSVIRSTGTEKNLRVLPPAEGDVDLQLVEPGLGPIVPPGEPLDRTGEKNATATSLTDTVRVPRWVLYTQGILLGLIATTFFVFGLAVGNTTGGHNSAAQDAGTCVISGSVYFDRGQERKADQGAVVILLPTDSPPRRRPDASGLRPDQFEPIRNQALDEIRGLGGCVVRADQDGNYQAELRTNQSYWWLVISRNQAATNDTIGKQTRAEMGVWFLPIEDLLGDREFMWQKLRLSGPQQKMQVVTF